MEKMRGAKLIPIRPSRPGRDPGQEADLEVVEFAYQLWLSRGFRGGSPQDDLFTATLLLRGGLKPFLAPTCDRTAQE
jgi:hypothetical protein